MRNRTWTTLITLAIVGAVALTGCAKANKQEAAVVAEKPKASVFGKDVKAKPPLEVPKSFSTVEEKRDFALMAFNKDYYKEAEPLLADMVKENPNDASAQAHLGTTKYMLNQFDDAIAAWTKAGDLIPAWPQRCRITLVTLFVTPRSCRTPKLLTARR